MITDMTLGFPRVFQGFSHKTGHQSGTGWEGRKAKGDVRIIASLAVRSCTDGQRSCLLGCQSTNEADIRFQRVYIASCNDHFSALGFPTKLVTNLLLVGRVEKLKEM